MKFWQIFIIWLMSAFAWSWFPDKEVWGLMCQRPLSELDLTPLLENPVDVIYEWLNDPMDINGNTPIHICAERGNLELLEKLLSMASCPDSLEVLVTAVNIHGYTPLHSAAWSGHQQCVSLLHDHGSSLTTTLTHGTEPLHSAALMGCTKVVRFLLEQGVSPMTVHERLGETPLHYAAERGHPGVMRVLLEFGALVNTVNKQGKTPLHLAAQKGHAEAVSLLLKHGASMEAVDWYNLTPLQYAIQRGHESVISELKKPGSCGSPRSLQHQAGFIVWQMAGCHFRQLQRLLTGLPPKLLRIILLILDFQDLLPEEGKDA